MEAVPYGGIQMRMMAKGKGKKKCGAMPNNEQRNTNAGVESFSHWLLHNSRKLGYFWY